MVNTFIRKVTNRTVGIVFSPTLNIPAPVFSLFVTEYETVFGDDEPDDPPPIQAKPPATPEPQSRAANNTDHASHSASNSQSNPLLSVRDPNPHRSRSAERQFRTMSSQPPPQFPLNNQGYQESQRPPLHQYQLSQSTYQQPQTYQRYPAPSYDVRYESREESDFYG
jgi:RalA-binding protein 1